MTENKLFHSTVFRPHRWAFMKTEVKWTSLRTNAFLKRVTLVGKNEDDDNKDERCVQGVYGYKTPRNRGPSSLSMQPCKENEELLRASL